MNILNNNAGEHSPAGHSEHNHSSQLQRNYSLLVTKPRKNIFALIINSVKKSPQSDSMDFCLSDVADSKKTKKHNTVEM